MRCTLCFLSGPRSVAKFHASWNPGNCEYFVMDCAPSSHSEASLFDQKDYVLVKGPTMNPDAPQE